MCVCVFVFFKQRANFGSKPILMVCCFLFLLFSFMFDIHVDVLMTIMMCDTPKSPPDGDGSMGGFSRVFFYGACRLVND